MKESLECHAQLLLRSIPPRLGWLHRFTICSQLGSDYFELPGFDDNYGSRRSEGTWSIASCMLLFAVRCYERRGSILRFFLWHLDSYCLCLVLFRTLIFAVLAHYKNCYSFVRGSTYFRKSEGGCDSRCKCMNVFPFCMNVLSRRAMFCSVLARERHLLPLGFVLRLMVLTFQLPLTQRF